MAYQSRLELVVDSSGARSQLRRFERDLTRTERTGQQTSESVDGVNASINRLRGVALAASGALVGLTGALGAREVIQYADAWRNAENRLKTVTDSTSELTSVQQKLMEAANGSRSSFESTVDLYARLKFATDELGVSQEGAIQLTSTLQKMLSLGGASAQEAASAATQLGQALGSGVLRGEEFNAVLEASPNIIDAIAQSMGKSRGEMRAMAEAGEITADRVVEAIQGISDQVEGEYSQSMATFADKMTQAQNNLTEFFGTSEEVGAGAEVLGDSIVMLTESLDEMAAVAKVVAGVFAARLFGNAATAGAAALSKSLAGLSRQFSGVALDSRRMTSAMQDELGDVMYQHSASMTQAQFRAQKLTEANRILTREYGPLTKGMQASTAATIAASAAGRGLSVVMAGLGGPVGVAALAATAVYSYREELGLVEPPAREAITATDDFAESVSNLSREITKNKITELKADMVDLERAAREATRSVSEQESAARQDFSSTIAMGLTGGAVQRQEAPRTPVGELKREAEEAQTEVLEAQGQLDVLEAHLESLGKPGRSGSGGGGGSSTLKSFSGDLARFHEIVDGPVQAAVRKHNDQMNMLESLYKAGKISQSDYSLATQKIAQTFQEAVEAANPVLQKIKDVREEYLGFTKDIAGLYDDRQVIQGNLSGPEQELAMGEWNQRRDEQLFGGMPSVRGLSPETGGAFSEANQIQGEADQQNAWFDRQLQQQQELLDAKIINEEQYAQRSNDLTRRREQENARIEQAIGQARLAGGEQLFGDLAGLAKGFAGEQSGIYKAMFATQKAFSIAQSIMSIQQGIAQAAAMPFPANLGAMATVAAATAGIVSDIQAVSLSASGGGDGGYAGAYDKGGRIPSGQWGIVGEVGPEIVKGPANVTGREETARKLKGGGDTYFNPEITVNVERSENDQGDGEQMGKQVAKAVETQVMNIMHREMRPRGVLDRFQRGR
ncbi:tape measure protein [Halomonas alimentaria]|uniref:Tape measure protein n=1 Tax=Halomonas alimentaria TaxID=147248 RepID=A0A7X4W655_9GAMM|nr:tape measure protein [Halomonas alimentaria]NAW34995.1 tape measure protein [Halomonas alimentaria]